MNVKFDFIMHWLWTITFSIMALSGLSMVGASFGWILNYDIGLADYLHRVFAAVYVLQTFIVVVYEVIRGIKSDAKKLTWLVIGKSKGYQIFTFTTTLIFIITGTIIWICMDSNMTATAFALYIHEKLTYIVIASVIWHMFKKCHALLWPVKTPNKQPGENTA